MSVLVATIGRLMGRKWNMFDKYPIGTVVRLSDDDPEDEPREVASYKQIHGSDYLVFKDGSMAYVGRVAE